MTTDDIGQGDLSGLPVPHDGEPQDALPGQPQADGPELDASGLPVQDRPAKKGRTYFLAAAALACSITGTWLSGVQINQVDAHRAVDGYLVGLGFMFSLLALILAGLCLFASDRESPAVPNFLQEKLGLVKLGRGGQAICGVAAALSVFGLIAPLVIGCPTCSG